MDSSKIETTNSWEPPGTVKDLQKNLGFANYYRRFIRGFSVIARPLINLLKKNTVYGWGSDEQSALDSLKKSFTSAPTSAFFDYNKQTVLETDASDWASGGVLSQYDDNKIHSKS
ncbi:hypothetical protein K3495_g5362 [Podosphaera aphanis]|nr:hypothetical protein K3495_g5362 [Podosphaera aphanis]